MVIIITDDSLINLDEHNLQQKIIKALQKLTKEGEGYYHFEARFKLDSKNKIQHYVSDLSYISRTDNSSLLDK
jgi:hypothetical protein